MLRRLLRNGLVAPALPAAVAALAAALARPSPTLFPDCRDTQAATASPAAAIGPTRAACSSAHATATVTAALPAGRRTQAAAAAAAASTFGAAVAPGCVRAPMLADGQGVEHRLRCAERVRGEHHRERRAGARHLRPAGQRVWQRARGGRGRLLRVRQPGGAAGESGRHVPARDARDGRGGREPVSGQRALRQLHGRLRRLLLAPVRATVPAAADPAAAFPTASGPAAAFPAAAFSAADPAASIAAAALSAAALAAPAAAALSTAALAAAAVATAALPWLL